jgi:hypothetical protein
MVKYGHLIKLSLAGLVNRANIPLPALFVSNITSLVLGSSENIKPGMTKPIEFAVRTQYKFDTPASNNRSILSYYS